MRRPQFEVADIIRRASRLHREEPFVAPLDTPLRSCWPSHAVAPPPGGAAFRFIIGGGSPFINSADSEERGTR